jgi:predicted lipoprotein
MKTFRQKLAYGLLSLSVVITSACSQKSPEEKVLTNITQEIVPAALKNWHTENKTFAELAKKYCIDSSVNLDQLQSQWHKTRQSWHHVQALPLGTLNEQSQSWQVQFWPDKKNLVEFQFVRLLQTNNTALDIEKVSTVLRGLGASEYLLFDTKLSGDAEPTRQTHCMLLLPNTAFQEQLSGKIARQWQEHSQSFIKFPNQSYANTNDALAEILRSEIAAIELLKSKLKAPPPENNTATQPYQAEFWRSSSSIDSIRQGIAAHKNIWQNEGWELLITEKNSSLANEINSIYQEIHAQLEDLKKPLPELLNDKTSISQLQELKNQIASLENAYGNGIAKTLGVQIGFNANDGD